MHTASATSTPQRPIRDWIVRHDDSRAFTVLYISLALVLSRAGELHPFPSR